jgi:hypothetical protein
MGVPSPVSNVSFNGAPLHGGWAYNKTSNVLDVRELANLTKGGAWDADWVLAWM